MKKITLIILLATLISCNLTITNSGSLVMETTNDKIELQANRILEIVKANDNNIKNEIILEFPEMQKEILEGSSFRVRKMSIMDESTEATIIFVYSISGSDMAKSQEIIKSYENLILPILNKNGFQFKKRGT